MIVGETWAAGDNDPEMMAQLRGGKYSDLNIYFQADDTADPADGVLGYCSLPRDIKNETAALLEDGCVVKAKTLPGGSMSNFNLGATATHEVGHFFGLLHVFEGEICTVCTAISSEKSNEQRRFFCSDCTRSDQRCQMLSCVQGDGDMVTDTPQQSVATEGCPTQKDSCPNSSGVDSYVVPPSCALKA